jgi:hypothetical protein
MGAKIQAFDIFQTPLSSHYPLPLSIDIFWWQGGWPALCEVFPVEEDVESRVWHTLVHLGVGLGLLALYLLYRKWSRIWSAGSELRGHGRKWPSLRRTEVKLFPLHGAGRSDAPPCLVRTVSAMRYKSLVYRRYGNISMLESVEVLRSDMYPVSWPY